MAVLSAFAYKYPKTTKMQDEPAITLETYNKKIANTHKAVLVYFSASWCAVCPKFKPVISEIEKEYRDKVEVLRIDTDRDIEVATELEINALPLLILYKNGKKEWTNSGIIPISDLRREIDCYL
ncbi:MAG: thioredoxin family protein [Bacteroidota bacterium]